MWRLCRSSGSGRPPTKKGRSGAGKTPGPAVHDDLVQRVFTAPAPDLVWLTDITEHPTVEGKLYCCAIKDVFSNRIVGYAIGDRMTAAARRLGAALRDRPPPTGRHRGGPQRPRRPIPRQSLPGRARSAAGLTRSMGRVASAGDNAAMESFYALLQKNVLDRRALAHPRRTRLRDRHLDRAHLQPPPPSTSPRQAHPRRVRTRLHPPARRRKQHDQSQPPSTERAADPFVTRPYFSGCGSLLPSIAIIPMLTRSRTSPHATRVPRYPTVPRPIGNLGHRLQVGPLGRMG